MRDQCVRTNPRVSNPPPRAQTVDEAWAAASWQGGRGGLRKALDVRNLTVCVDPRGKHQGAAFQTPLLRTAHSRAMASLPVWLHDDADDADDDFNPQVCVVVA
jgi:hypothetical protein